jgi:predicted NAD/FAD-dependent oxidoreductase
MRNFRRQMKERGLRPDMTSATYWRYATGQLPGFGKFLLANPDLAIALAVDAVQAAIEGEEPFREKEEGRAA